MKAIELAAHAKVNLGLEVLRRRPDGYHDVCTVLHAIELHDSLSAEPAEELSLHVESVTNRAGEQELQAEGNLALKAARLLQERSGTAFGAKLRLRKMIPIAAGLGGGSSDAAAALSALNSLWELHWSRERLAQLAAMLGADVSFFLSPGAGLARGRGDEVSLLPSLLPTWLVLVIPDVVIADKTRWAYSQLAPQHYSSGAFTLDIAQRLRSGRLSLSGSHLRNVFEPVLVSAVPLVARCRSAMWSEGVLGVNLAGAGPTLFASIADEVEAVDAAARLRSRLEGQARVALTRTVAAMAAV